MIPFKLKIGFVFLIVLPAFLILTKLHSSTILSKLGPYLGKKVAVEYFVSYPYESKQGHVFLNGKDFTAVIFEGAVSRFRAHPIELYGNRRIRVNGLLQNYKGHPEIIVYNPKQIKIVSKN